MAQLTQLSSGEADVPANTFGCSIDRSGETRAQLRNTHRVAGGGGVALIDRADGNLDDALERSFDPCVQLRVLDRHRGLAREGACEPNLATSIRHDESVGGFLARDTRAWIRFSVDENEQSREVVEMIDHRDEKHRPASILVVFIERAIDSEARVRRKTVSVGNHDRLFDARGVSRDTRIVDGKPVAG